MSYGGDTQELELSDYLAILRRRWSWALVPLVLIVGLSVFYTLIQTDRFEATAKVLLADDEAQQALDPSSQNSSFLNRELSNEILLARSDTAVASLTRQFGEEPTVSISADSSADVLIFDATADDAVLAADYANAWANTYVTLKQDEAAESLGGALANLRQQLIDLRVERQDLRKPLDLLADRQARATTPERADQLQREYDRLNDDLSYEVGLIDDQASAAAASVANLELRAELSATGTARIAQNAAPPIAPSNAPLSRNVALGVVIGFILGIGIALLRDTLDQSLRTEEDVREMSDVPILATVPAPRKQLKGTVLALASQNDPHGQQADAYQRVRSALQFARIGADVTSVLVTSANQSEGKTTTSSNLAWALASVGKRTVLVDVDFRRPLVHEVFGIGAEPGLADNILHGTSFSELASAPAKNNSHLLVLPVGAVPPNPAAFVGSTPFLDSIDWLTKEADAVILDAPPVLPVSDALTMSTHADAIILTVMARKTTKGNLKSSLESLQRVGANILGIVLLGVKPGDGYARYGYGPATPKNAGMPAPSSNGVSPEERQRGKAEAKPDEPTADTSPTASHGERGATKQQEPGTGMRPLDKGSSGIPNTGEIHRSSQR